MGEDEDPGWEKKYPAYVINKCMSHHMDTVMFANEMNLHSTLDNRLQYDFFINIVRSRKRFSPWGKKEKIDDLELVKRYYGCLLYTSPSPRDMRRSRMPSSA